MRWDRTILSRITGEWLHFIAAHPGAGRTDSGRLALCADVALSDLPGPDVILTLTGYAARAQMNDASPAHIMQLARYGAAQLTGVGQPE